MSDHDAIKHNLDEIEALIGKHDTWSCGVTNMLIAALRHTLKEIRSQCTLVQRERVERDVAKILRSRSVK